MEALGPAGVNPPHQDPIPVARTVRAGTVSGESDPMVGPHRGGSGGVGNLNWRGWIVVGPPVGGKN